MSKTIYLLLLVCLAPNLVNAQYRATFSAAGGSGTAGSNEIQFTIGESISGLIATSATYRLTTGFYAPPPDDGGEFNPPVIAILGLPVRTPDGTPVTIESDVTDPGSGVSTVTLFHRKGGDPTFSQVNMTNTSGDTYSGVVPAESITTRGAEFFITAVDNSSNVAQNSAVPIIVDITAPGRESTLRQGRQQSDYRLISVPMNLTNKASSTVLTDLGPYDNTKWRFWNLKNNYFDFEGEEQFTELTGGASFEPGAAFFILSAEGGTFRTGAAASISTVVPFTKTLHRGWNFLGNPFDFNIPIGAISLSTGTTPNVQSFAGGWSGATALQPFQGYIIDAGENDNATVSINPNLSAGKTAGKNDGEADSESEIAWSIRIDARSGELFDHNNLVAVGSSASREWDALDRPEPPSLGDFVSVYFPHSEWGLAHKRFEVDTRPEPAGGDAWDFEVATGSRKTVTLSFNGVIDVPAHYSVHLIDRMTGYTQDVRSNPEYTVIPTGKGLGWPLQLLIGESDYVRGQIESLDLLPGNFNLDQNYPNPFNPTTSIRYGISEEATVTLKVYNLLGQTVATLVDGERKQAGYHVSHWDARFDDGSEAASGLYIYRLQITGSTSSATGESTLTRKMLLVK